VKYRVTGNAEAVSPEGADGPKTPPPPPPPPIPAAMVDATCDDTCWDTSPPTTSPAGSSYCADAEKAEAARTASPMDIRRTVFTTIFTASMFFLAA